MATHYLAGYPQALVVQASALLAEGRLGAVLLAKYPSSHAMRTDKALYDYVLAIKNECLRGAEPLAKVVYDSKLEVLSQALGTHTTVSRVQGSKLKSKREIRVASLFKEVPVEFLRMIVVHELAHLKERAHDKAFYQLCNHLEPNYHQYEFDLRLYLMHRATSGKLDWPAAA